MEKDKISFQQIASWIASQRLGTLRPEEEQQLKEWLQKEPRFEKIYNELLNVEQCPEGIRMSEQEGWSRFVRKYPQVNGRCLGLHFVRYTVACCLIVLFGSIWFFAREQRKEIYSVNTLQPVERIYGARLVTGDGQVMALTEHSGGDTMHLAATVVVDQEGIGYLSGKGANAPEYHTIIVPKYGEYTVRLGDGSRIRLNSESELRYPVNFSDSVREVWLKGEAYFQVARDTGRPFIVSAARVKVNVLGTEFNVEAIPGRGQVTTTLVEGRVRVEQGETKCILKPGEQAVAGGEILEKQLADIRAVTAWVRGMFCFNEVTLQDMMQCLAEWYGFEVEYRNPALKERKFSVELKRYEDVDRILRLIEETGTVRFQREGIRVTVY